MFVFKKLCTKVVLLFGQPLFLTLFSYQSG